MSAMIECPVQERAEAESPIAPAPKQLSTAFLDGLRGLAAVYVLVHHGLLWLHPGYRFGYLKHPGQYGRWGHAVLIGSSVFRFGHSAVLFFFVLSGFVIHLRYARRMKKGEPPALAQGLPFLRKRLFRLYPPLLLAIAVTYFLDRLGISHGYAIYFAHTPYPVINDNVTASHASVTLIGNLLFLMQTYVPVWGTDSPLWSLKFEWWFYVAYPLFWPLLRRSFAAATVTVAILYSLSFFPAAWPLALLRDIFSGMIMWWLGVLLAEIHAGRINLTFRAVALLTVLLPVAFVLGILGRGAPDMVWALGFTGFIALCFYWLQRGRSLAVFERLKGLGDCSYTLYVIHAPILILASGWLMSRSATGELSGSFVPALCSLLIIPLAYALHFVVEKPFAGRGAPRKPRNAPGSFQIVHSV